MGIISTGQFTIVDQNDAAPITTIISANGTLQQTYTYDNALPTFMPNWVSTPLTLTANVFVRGVSVSGSLDGGSAIWSTSFDGSSIGTGPTFVRNTNFTTPDTVASQVYYFRATYTDPVTAIVTRVDAQITLGAVKVGSNAVFAMTEGINIIKQSSTSTKNAAAIKATLFRAAGIDADNLQYRWYSVSSAGVATKLYSGVGGVANYAVKSTAIAAAPTTAATLGSSTFTAAAATTSGVSTSTADWCTAGSPGYNTLVIGEGAVNSTQLFKVEIRDFSDGGVNAPVYSTTFMINDVSDPYQVSVYSVNGDRLANGMGSTQLSPVVYSGASEIADYTGWSFDWYLRDKAGNRTGFTYAATLTNPVPTLMRNITSNTTGALVLSAAVSAAELPINSLVKLVSADGGIVKFAETVAGTSSTTVTLKALTGDNGNVNGVASIVASEFAGGKFYRAVSKKTTSGQAAFALSEHDVDGKNTVVVDAIRP